ncbi:MAG: class I SAM-dependent methyltransferase [Candidatus Thorarchaeota archaeon]|jgi:ubiquinone/menaquinone biosynthesis C-methylase UbiE
MGLHTSTTMKDSVRNQWEENAELYAKLIADSGTPHHKDILNPSVELLVGDVKGKQFLDAGCGEGYLSRYYASKGATVTGVDFSEKLVTIAREKTDNSAITFQKGNLCDLKEFSDSVFDIILCNLVLLNVACLPESMMEFNRVLKQEGILVFSIVHPAFDFYGPGAWEMGEKNPQTNRREGLYFKIDQYTVEKAYERYWRTTDGETFPEPITFYHRTISTYVSKLLKSGFQIEAIEEPLPDSKNPFFDRERRIPFFLVIKAVKK